MPYNLRKAPKKNLWWVVNADSGKKYSKSPLPRERAESQRRAIYASENGYVLNRSRSKSTASKSKSKSKSRKLSRTKYAPTPRYIQRYKEMLE